MPAEGVDPDPLLDGLPPILPDGAIRALILGSFPSVASLQASQYYAHPQNWFWRVLAHCGVIDRADAPYQERTAQLRRRGIAVWDLYAQTRRRGSGDDAIRDPVVNPIDALYRHRGPFPILLNGRRTREWRRRFPDLGIVPTPLPSTSPRPLHWNTPESRAAAISEWRAALSAALAAPSTTSVRQ